MNFHLKSASNYISITYLYLSCLSLIDCFTGVVCCLYVFTFDLVLFAVSLVFLFCCFAILAFLSGRIHCFSLFSFIVSHVYVTVSFSETFGFSLELFLVAISIRLFFFPLEFLKGLRCFSSVSFDVSLAQPLNFKQIVFIRYTAL